MKSTEFTFRVLNNESVPELPGLNDSDEPITNVVKGKVLTHQEVDNDFQIILKYLEKLAQNVINLRSIFGDIDGDQLQELVDRLKRMGNLDNDLSAQKIKLDGLESEFNRFKNDTLAALAKKIEDVKTINGTTITGKGNALINISRNQFTNHLTDIDTFEVGSILELKPKIPFKVGTKIDAEFLELPENDIQDEGTIQGTWRCLASLSSETGLFMRLN